MGLDNILNRSPCGRLNGLMDRQEPDNAGIYRSAPEAVLITNAAERSRISCVTAKAVRSFCNNAIESDFRTFARHHTGLGFVFSPTPAFPEAENKKDASPETRVLKPASLRAFVCRSLIWCEQQ